MVQYVQSKTDTLEEESPPQSARPQGGLLSKYTNVEIFAYILAGISAIGATWSSIGRMFADSIENMTWVKNLKEIRDSKLDIAFTRLRNNLAQNPHNTSRYQQEYKTEQRQIRREYKKNYSHTLQKEMGVYNTYDKWLQLPRHQKIATFMTIAGVLSIAGLALYTIGKEKTLRKKFEEEKEKRIEEAKAAAEHALQHPAVESTIETDTTPPTLTTGSKAAGILAERSVTADANAEVTPRF